MKYNPHDYQKYAMNFIITHSISAILLDCGMGKSSITLSAINQLMYDYFEVSKILVVCPLRVANTWVEEIAKWDEFNHITYSLVIGSETERKKALRTKADIYIVNLENVDWLVNKSEFPFDFDMVVIDELSSFKSNQSKRFKSLLKVRPKVKRIVGLTGTPSSNGLMDLWAEFRILDMGERLGRYISNYRNNFFVPDKRNQQMIFSYKPRPGAEDAIYRLISDITISMKSADFLQMPDCIINEVEVKLSEKERATYDELRQEMVVSRVTKSVGDLGELQLQFWTNFVEYCKADGRDKDIAFRKPLAQNWYDVPMNGADYHLSYTVTSEAKCIIYKREADVFNPSKQEEYFSWMIDKCDELSNALVQVGEMDKEPAERISFQS